MLIGIDGDKHGLMSFNSAIDMADKSGVDLVQVSPMGADPVVCKLMDYGKHIFAKKKNITSSKGKAKRNTVKEIKFRPSTDVGDYNIKLKDKKLYS